MSGMIHAILLMNKVYHVFENTMTEYARTGGRESTDAELKSDLLRTLLREIRETLL